MRHLLLLLAMAGGCATPESGIRPPDGVEVAALRGDFAELLGRHHQTDAALATARAAVAAAPRDAHLRRVLGTQLATAGLLGDAETELRLAGRLDPSHAPAHDALGVVLDRQHRRDEALAEHAAAVRLDPGCARCWNNLGFALYLAHRNDEAVHALETALRLDPQSATTTNNLGFAYLRRGEIASAEQLFRRAGGDSAAARNLAVGRALAREAR